MTNGVSVNLPAEIRKIATRRQRYQPSNAIEQRRHVTDLPPDNLQGKFTQHQIRLFIDHRAWEQLDPVPQTLLLRLIQQRVTMLRHDLRRCRHITGGHGVLQRHIQLAVRCIPRAGAQMPVSPQRLALSCGWHSHVRCHLGRAAAVGATCEGAGGCRRWGDDLVGRGDERPDGQAALDFSTESWLNGSR